MKYLGAVLGLIFLFAACSSISVYTDFDEEIDFAKYKTFQWKPAPPELRKGPFAHDGLMDKRVRQAIVSDLVAKGYVKAVGEAPDFFVAYYAGVKEKVDITTVDYGWRRGFHRGTAVQTHRYKEGSIVIDVVDPELKQLVWRGVGHGLVGNPGEIKKKIPGAVAEVLKDFPPK